MRPIAAHPVHRPIRLGRNGGDRLDRIEEMHLLVPVLDVPRKIKQYYNLGSRTYCSAQADLTPSDKCVESAQRCRRALIDEQAVRLRVDVLHRHLEAVESAGLRHLNLVSEVDRQVLVDDTVRSSEEGQDVLDEVLLVRVEFLRVFRLQEYATLS